MQKSLFAIVAALIFGALSSGGAQAAGPYPFGDEPYTLSWGSYRQIESGCWKWNWQQYFWNDYCAVYEHPKAYMYPRSSRVVLHSKG
jgi:hypothetical protein